MERSKNGTFLFDRRYMDYHEDRFADHSFMFYRDNRLYAMLPANVCGDTLFSHQGLTYGGLITSHEARTVHVMEMFRLLNDSLRSEGIRRVVYKATPTIYHRMPSEEDLYAIHRECDYRILERDVSSTIFPKAAIKWKKDRRHGLRKAHDMGMTVERSTDFGVFWDILTANLMENHGTKPVHSLDEMLLLHSRFPDRIRLYVSRRGDETLGGCVVYVMPDMVHTQYISATREGKRNGAIDIIIDHLLNREFPNVGCIDFGKSTEGNSMTLNEDLIYQKEGFGGRAICYDTYEWTL